MSAKNIFGLAALLLTTGCAPLSQIYIGQKSQASEQPYYSKVIMPEYGFTEISCENPNLIDETKYPKVENDSLSAVGCSYVHSTQEAAISDARSNGIREIMNYKDNSPKKQAYIKKADCLTTEIHKVRSKDGTIGYAAHSLFKVPLSGIKKKISR